MRTSQRALGIAIFFIGLCFASTPLSKGISLAEYTVTSPGTGDVYISLEFLSEIDGTVRIEAIYPSSISSQHNTSISVLNSSQQVQSNCNFNVSCTFTVARSGYHHVDFHIYSNSEDGKTQEFVYPIYFDYENDQIVQSFYTHPKSASETDIQIKSGIAELSDGISSGGESMNKSMNYTISVNVTGQVSYLYNYTDKGVPGIVVLLDWDSDDNPNTVAIPEWSVGDPEIQHYTYDITDSEGYFNFIYTFSSSVPANLITEQLRVTCGRSNLATYDVHLGYTGYLAGAYGLLDITEMTETVIGVANVFDYDPIHGSALRYLERARVVAINEFGVNPDCVPFEYDPQAPTSFFDYGPITQEMIIFDEIPEMNTAAYHEYGHFIEHFVEDCLPSSSNIGNVHTIDNPRSYSGLG